MREEFGVTRGSLARLPGRRQMGEMAQMHKLCKGPGGQATWCLESDCPEIGQPRPASSSQTGFPTRSTHISPDHQEEPLPSAALGASYLFSPPLPSPRASTALCQAHQAVGVSALYPSPHPDCAHSMLTGLCCPLSPATSYAHLPPCLPSPASPATWALAPAAPLPGTQASSSITW